MDFKKQRPDPPFFFEKEQVIPLLRQRSKTGMKDWVKRSLDEIDSLFPIDRINRSKERWTRVWTGERPLDRYPFHTGFPLFNPYNINHPAEERLRAYLDACI